MCCRSQKTLQSKVRLATWSIWNIQSFNDSTFSAALNCKVSAWVGPEQVVALGRLETGPAAFPSNATMDDLHIWSILTFEAIHPKWSYAKVDKNNLVTEVAEKKVT